MNNLSYTIQDFSCSLEDFSGPFDLLLSLAAREEIDSRRIQIVEVISQFLQKGSSAFEDKACFAYSAAWLHSVKSSALTQQEHDAVENPPQDQEELKKFLDSFDHFKKAQDLSLFLHTQQTAQRPLFYRPAQPLPKAKVETKVTISIQELEACFQTLLKKNPIREHHLTPDEISFEEEKSAFCALLGMGPQTFISLFENLARNHQISRFLVLLELVKGGQLHIYLEGSTIFLTMRTADA